MGFFDNLKSALTDFTSWVSAAPAAIASGVKTVYTDVKGGVVTAFQTARDVGTGIIDKYSQTVNHVIDAGTSVGNNLVTKAGDTIGSIAQSLSMPLLLIGLGGAAYFLLKR